MTLDELAYSAIFGLIFSYGGDAEVSLTAEKSETNSPFVVDREWEVRTTGTYVHYNSPLTVS